MKSTRSVLRWVALAAVLGITACGGDDDGPTNPVPGGLELNSGDIAAGGIFDHTFSSAGTFDYHCTRHSEMTGNSVIVDPGSNVMSAAVSIVGGTPGYDPATVTIGVGGAVHWTNNDGTPHTVTSGD